MRIYLDLCCLKRPFDAQEQPLVRLQTEAVVSILALPAEVAELIRVPAQALENSLNPVQARRDAVGLWLAQVPDPLFSDAEVSARVDTLLAMGFKSFDAFHLASAELSGADVFLTVDLPLLKLAARLSSQLHVRVADPVRFLEEISEWIH
ncbi:MAG TPA: PIN domain-containing protein [Thermoanaerobaculia bacterium]|nr:PIN domain-containing protein [Thermoanaerobaculia bacterium]